MYWSHSTSEGWPLMLPCLFWNGKGGPDDCVYSKISLREWVNYVIRISSLDFQRHVIFISFANILLRRQRITGLTVHKPISGCIEQAVKELPKISHSAHPSDIPECTLNSLARKVGTYVDDLPGSLADMKKFRNDILSMEKKHGPPSYFLTLSAADSMWPEGFIEASNGKLSLEQAKALSATERADLMAKNPVAITIAWKKRVRAFLNFIINGESKPLGNIKHYAQKAEWQGRLSEHVHFLFWTKDPVQPLTLKENGDLEGDQRHITMKVESFSSAMIHLYQQSGTERDEYSSSSQEHEHDFRDISLQALPLEQIFEFVTKEPSSFFVNYFAKNGPRKSINDLVRSVNLHSCSAYCTKSGTTPCKSKFPFQTTGHSKVRKMIDKNLNKSYRVHLRRNHPRVNPYSVPILNFWRGNMDLTVLCGNPFLSILYETYYTSKVDKSSNIRDVLQKAKKLDANTDTQVLLRKLLINMDTCRATGLPETSSNLLLYPHKYTCSKVLRLDTRAYLPVDDFQTTMSDSLNSLLHDATKTKEEFAIPDPDRFVQKTQRRNSETPPLDKLANVYFSRPEMLYGPNNMAINISKQMSMTEYIENYKVTQKQNISNSSQSRDKENKVIEPRCPTEQDIVLDLKFRVSPPDTKNPKWCAGALALHVPHSSIKSLLEIDGTTKGLVEAYQHYFWLKTSSENGLLLPLYPLLHKFEQNETDLYNATMSGYLRTSTANPKEQDAADDIDHLYEDGNAEQENEEIELDPDLYSSAETSALTNLKNVNCKVWNGLPQANILSSDNPWSASSARNNSSSVINADISADHSSFMSLLLPGKNPRSSTSNEEVEQALSYAKGDQKAAAANFITATMAECKNDEQRKAINTITDDLENYYYGDNSQTSEPDHVDNTPIITMIGVPGAGKSWVVGKVRTWVDIRCSPLDLPCTSAEFVNLSHQDGHDIVTGKVREAIEQLPEGKYGKSAAFAFSGASAGIIKGFTVHQGFSFPINMNKQEKNGSFLFHR